MPSAEPTTVSGDGDRLISVHPDELSFSCARAVLISRRGGGLVGNRLVRCGVCVCVGVTRDGIADYVQLVDEIPFLVELETQSFLDLKVVNNTENHVAFKVKTTSPKKYFVRPNSSVIQPQEECFVRVTLQAQREYPPVMQCRDKFLVQSTIVPPNTDMGELSQDVFNKDGGRVVEEIKLRVVYVYPNSEEISCGDNLGSPFDDSQDNDLVDLDRALQRLKTERDTAIRQVQLLQKDLELLKRRSYQRKPYGFSILATLVVGFIGIFVGLASTFLFAPQRNA